MSISQAICDSFKKEIVEGIHDFTADTFKIALYTSNATLSNSTTAYTTTEEASGTGYTAGGATLTIVAPTLSSGTTIIDASDVTWSTVTVTVRGALIYNSSKANRAVMVLDFGSDRVLSAGDLTVKFPNPDRYNAILRIT